MPSLEPPTTRLTNFQHMFRSLRGRNFSLFFFGQGVSVVGTWMQSTALAWLVYRITNDPLMLGLVGFAGTIFSFLISPIAGVFTDRWNRHRALVAMQALSMLQAGVLAALTLSGTIQVWHILALAVFIGVVNAIDIPNRQSFVVHMVPKREDLPNAIALNSFLFNSARLVGPPIAGYIIWAGDLSPGGTGTSAFNMRGEGFCFAANAVSYAAVIVALLAMKIAPRVNGVRRHVLHELREGFAYTMGFPPIRTILLMLAMLGFTAMPYATLIPVFARDILHGGSATQGQLMGAAGAGAILAAIYLASRRSVRGLGILIGSAAVLLGAGLIVFGLSNIPALSMAILALVGFGQMTQMAGSNTMLQTIVDDDKRGRVMSFYTIAFMGTAPFGNLLAGWSAKHIGAPRTVMIGGAICAICGLLFIRNLPNLRKHVRPIYVRMGIIDEESPIPQDAVEENK
jgi:MFS family permease